MTAQSRLDDTTSEKLRDTGIISKASWVWWGLLAACLIVTVLSIGYAIRRSSHQGDGRNRGPALEAAPGAQPARDIDRSKSP
jgi:hypothetical protein